MPLLTTLTLLALTRDEAPEQHPFTDPGELNIRLTQLPAGESRTRALAIAGEMQHLLSEYRQHLDRALDIYIEDSEKSFIGAEEFQVRFEPLDQEGHELVLGFIQQRQALLELLTPEQWQAIFGQG